ncbi:MAG: hypothetical protein HYZ62_01915 [Candidatus Andersenbacteria bacterium]|nr:hypothetical protein [Candidatus Andersenbacteria bacterium]
MKILLKHVGNMGDLIFLLPPVLESLKHTYPDCHITLVTAWGFKETAWKINWHELRKMSRAAPLRSLWQRGVARRAKWGKRNQSGFCISLMASNPHIDQLVHWHDTRLSLDAAICQEEGISYPTWNQAYFASQKKSGHYDLVSELDMGITQQENPLGKIYAAVGLPQATYSNYKIYFTPRDREVAQHVVASWPKPRIILLEGLEGRTTRGWDEGKIPGLSAAIQKKYNVEPRWFGARFQPRHQGLPLTLRQNIATLALCDAAIGVLSGPLHFAAAAGLPTITLLADQYIHRAAPAYFLNPYISHEAKKHRTLLGPSNTHKQFLKHDEPSHNLTLREAASQHSSGWLSPGRQSTKTPLATITVEEVMTVLQDVLD